MKTHVSTAAMGIMTSVDAYVYPHAGYRPARICLHATSLYSTANGSSARLANAIWSSANSSMPYFCRPSLMLRLNHMEPKMVLITRLLMMRATTNRLLRAVIFTCRSTSARKCCAPVRGLARPYCARAKSLSSASALTVAGASLRSWHSGCAAHAATSALVVRGADPKSSAAPLAASCSWLALASASPSAAAPPRCLRSTLVGDTSTSTSQSAMSAPSASSALGAAKPRPPR